MAYLTTPTDAVNMISGAGQNAAEAILRRLVDAGDYANPHDLVKDALKELEPLFQAVSERTASISATSYDLLRSEALGEGMGALAYPDRAEEWTRKAMYAAAAQSKDDMDAFIRAVRARLDYEAKRAAGTTMFANGAADRAHPRFARVPTGAETCPFCIMLASRGFVYWSSDTAGNLDHYHSHCDCRVVPQFGGESYEGYDPEEYYDRYQKLMASGELSAEGLSASASRAKARKKATPRTRGPRETGNYHRISGQHTRQDDIANANPNFKKGLEYQVNCQRCVPTYLARRRGFDVVAKPAVLDQEGLDKDDDFKNRWTEIYGGAHFSDFTDCGAPTRNAQLGKVERFMRSCGDNATAVVYIQWESGSAHVFVADRVDGKTTYCDPQNGRQSCKSYFRLAKTGKSAVAVFRIDGCDMPDDLLRECCEDRV